MSALGSTQPLRRALPKCDSDNFRVTRLSLTLLPSTSSPPKAKVKEEGSGSSDTVVSYDFLSSEVLRIGRYQGTVPTEALPNVVSFSDPRVSGLHCTIKRVSSAKFVLVDVSTNGTWMNGERVEAHIPLPLAHGDEIGVLVDVETPARRRLKVEIEEDLTPGRITSGKCDPALFLTPSRMGEREKCDPASVSSTSERNNIDDVTTSTSASTPDDGLCEPKDPKVFAEQLSQELSCGICADVLHKPVMLLPCCHSFCRACHMDWTQESTKEAVLSNRRRNQGSQRGLAVENVQEVCPLCRASVVHRKANYQLESILEAFLEAHPELKRSREEIAALDKKETFLEKRLLFREKKFLSTDEEIIGISSSKKSVLCNIM